MNRKLIVDAGLFHQYYPHDSDLAPDRLTRRIEQLSQAIEATETIVAGDSREKLIRKEIDPNYKADRTPKPREFYDTQDEFLQRVDDKGWLELIDGYEADDIIHTASTQAACNDAQAVIWSRDSDLNACLSEGKINRLSRMYVKNAKLYDPVWVTAKSIVTDFGIDPTQWPEMMAIAGGKDNVKGAEGIGKKTALKLIQKYGTVEKLVSGWDQEDGICNGKQVQGLAKWIEEGRYKIDLQLFQLIEIEKSFFSEAKLYF